MSVERRGDPSDATLIERLWFGDELWARVGRSALAPLELVYGAIARARGAMYETRLLKTHDTAIPAISVGNLSVGGTGKTPFAAFLAERLVDRGARPAIVLRGYGEDEPLVHRVLNPGVPVIVAPDRVDGAVRARAAGADVAVLDDAFQHRRARRVADVVLLSADRWTGTPHLLPAGPFREPLGALRRASTVVITRKAESLASSAVVAEAAERVAPLVPQAWAHLALRELRELDGAGRQPLHIIAGRNVRALLGIGDPRALIRQLAGEGANVSAAIYPDHHHFSDDEIAAFARSLRPDDIAVCTLKDAVKVRGRWPREAAPLWYVSQHVFVERGSEIVEKLLGELMHARTIPPSTAR